MNRIDRMDSDLNYPVHPVKKMHGILRGYMRAMIILRLIFLSLLSIGVALILVGFVMPDIERARIQIWISTHEDADYPTRAQMEDLLHSQYRDLRFWLFLVGSLLVLSSILADRAVTVDPHTLLPNGETATT